MVSSELDNQSNLETEGKILLALWLILGNWGFKMTYDREFINLQIITNLTNWEPV